MQLATTDVSGYEPRPLASFSPKEISIAQTAARHDYYFFNRWMFLNRKGYHWQRGPHHKLICDTLTKVFEGEITRLVINIAPRYSKTETAVVNFIPWCLGQVPDSEFIHPSYSGNLATINSWAAREVVTHPAYQQIFPSVRLRSDSSAKDHWRTTAGGVMYATGVGGTATGFGAGKMRPGFGGAIIIDDPHKADEARSDVVRKGVIEWFQNTLESRKNSPHTPIIVIMQRLHEEDLAGWLLGGDPIVDGLTLRNPGGNGEQWHHLCISTLREDGTALWTAKHDAPTLQRMQMAAPITFAGQYQQRPSAADGNIFKPDMMPIVDAIPVGTRFVRAWDFGAGGVDSDPTCGIKLGKCPDGSFIVADEAHFIGRPDDVKAGVKNNASADGTQCRVHIPQDPGQAGVAQVQDMVKFLGGFSVQADPISGDKVTRAEPFASQVNVGNVKLLRAPWNDKYKAELRVFPNGKHDDRVDASADAYNMHNGGNLGLFDFIKAQADTKAAAEEAEKKALEADPNKGAGMGILAAIRAQQ